MPTMSLSPRPPIGERLEQLLDQARALFAARHEIVCAYAFGSRIRGTSSGLSDLDLAVLTDRHGGSPEKGWQTYWGDLHARLVKQLALRDDDLDLLILDEVKDPVIRHRATWCGRLIFCRDHEARVRFETRVLLRYLDTAYLRKVQEQALFNWAAGFQGGTGGT
ncbi:MAG: nucleotidyltransferase domain-containing protein [Candidatus Riflebacteria bacterium]|nr:nucleotidyltransferase domain-containing protein [Candidatus Riflebacteria bacterium]